MKPDYTLEQVELLPYMAKWLLLSVVAAALAGSASAFFLFALERVTQIRVASPQIIWLLPWPGSPWGGSIIASERMSRPATT